MAGKKQAKNSGQFTPGVSGNPSGRPRAVRTDGVVNPFTGHGTGDDRRSFSRHYTKPMLDQVALDLRRGNWIAKAICEWLPKDVFRKGYSVKLDNKEEAEEVTTVAESLGLNQRVAELGAMARTVGGGALFPVLDGAVGDTSEPLDLDSPRILSVRAIHLLEKRELQAISYYDDINHPKFRKPERYRVMTIGGRQPTATVIHESRLAIMYGDRVSVEDQPGQYDGWGDGKLTPAEEIIHDYGMAWGSAATILHNFSERVQAVEGLMKILANKDGASILTANLRRMDMLRSTLRTRITDAAATVTESAKSVAGLSDMLIQMAQLVSGAGDIPMTRLFGMSPAGMNATGEFDLVGIHERVAAEQSHTYTPIVEWLLRLILLSADGPTGGVEPDVWGIQWNPLKQQSESEIATTRKTVMETDQGYVDMGVPAEQILKSRFGGDTYSMETTIDWVEYEKQQAAIKEAQQAEADAAAAAEQPAETETAPDAIADGGENVQQTVLNGAQVTSMVEVIRSAVSGEVPRESAMQIMQVAFGVSAEQASALLGPESFKPAAPEPKPNPFAPAPPAAKPDQPPPEEERTDSATDDLIEEMGGKCKQCGATEGLEVDHTNGRDWDPAELSKEQRAQKYRDEYEAGVKLQVLCRSCNASDGAKNKQEHG